MVTAEGEPSVAHAPGPLADGAGGTVRRTGTEMFLIRRGGYDVIQR